LKLDYLQGEAAVSDYRVARKLAVESDQAIDSAKVTLASVGFRIQEKSDELLDCTGPGLRSTRQNPLLGASRIVLRVANGHLTLDAELEGVYFMQRFVRWFPIALGLGLGVVLGIVQGIVLGRQAGIDFGVPWAPGWKWMALTIAGCLIPVSPWLVLSPMIARSLERRTRSALDTLLVNAAS
jgi:hypothetical protein